MSHYLVPIVLPMIAHLLPILLCRSIICSYSYNLHSSLLSELSTVLKYLSGVRGTVRDIAFHFCPEFQTIHAGDGLCHSTCELYCSKRHDATDGPPRLSTDDAQSFYLTGNRIIPPRNRHHLCRTTITSYFKRIKGD